MQRLLIWLLEGYKHWVSPVLPSACRFHPTCSVYARDAIQMHGAWRGTWLAVKRLFRCHPFHPGGLDPVPRPPGVEGVTEDDPGSSSAHSGHGTVSTGVLKNNG